MFKINIIYLLFIKHSMLDATAKLEDPTYKYAMGLYKFTRDFGWACLIIRGRERERGQGHS